MDIRLVRESDRDEWLRMRATLWPDTSLEEHRKDIDEVLADLAATPVFVAVRPGGGLGGFLEAGTRPYADGCHTKPVGYIEGWYVDADLRRQQVGAKLVQAAEDWARARGCQEMASDCEEDNHASELAHKALGYHEKERLIHFQKSLADDQDTRRG